MSPTLRNINVITSTGAIVLLVMSIWPDYAGGCCGFLVGAGAAGLLGVSWLFVVLQAQYRRKWPPVRQMAAAPLVVLLTYAMLNLYIPRRVAFIACQEQFDEIVARSVSPTTTTAPSTTLPDVGSRQTDPVPLNRRLGVYRVDQYAIDPRGGIYFRTGTGQDGMGPDTMSYGFVYRPNPDGTPFGASRYLVRRIRGDWHWFQASNDWF